MQQENNRRKAELARSPGYHREAHAARVRAVARLVQLFLERFGERPSARVVAGRLGCTLGEAKNALSQVNA